MCFHIHNSTGCKGGVTAAGLSVEQAHAYEQEPGVFRVYKSVIVLNDFCINVMRDRFARYCDLEDQSKSTSAYFIQQFLN